MRERGGYSSGLTPAPQLRPPTTGIKTHRGGRAVNEDRPHAKIPGSENSENGYLGQCWCQHRDDAWPCRAALDPDADA